MYICTCSFSECSYLDLLHAFWHSLVFVFSGSGMFFLLINDVTVNGFWVSVKFHLNISPQFCATPDAMHQAPTAHLRQVPGELLHIPPHVSAQLRHLHPVGVRVKRSKGLVLGMFLSPLFHAFKCHVIFFLFRALQVSSVWSSVCHLHIRVCTTRLQPPGVESQGHHRRKPTPPTGP